MKSYLTKTDFINSFICPTKLNYLSAPDQYTDATVDDEYLQSLSDGGYQIGKLAQLYFKEGVEISDNNLIAINETSKLLKNNEIVLFEAAIQHANFFIRVDILRKQNNKIDLFEVKAKSYKSSEFSNDIFYNKDGSISSEWKEYFYDLAFQYYVVSSCFPDYEVNCFFNLPNKNINSTVDNLFNKFSIKNKKATFLGTDEDLKDNIISEVNVTKKIKEVIKSTFIFHSEELNFYQIADKLAYAKDNSHKYPPMIGNHCKNCQFQDPNPSKSGIYQCWKGLPNFSNDKFNSQKVIDIWNYRSTQKLIEQNKYFLDDLKPDDINIENEAIFSDHPFSNKVRQFFQCFGINDFKNDEGFVRNDGYLKKEISKWVFPLNFIDFETATPAIPAYKGLAPYEQIAFQYSIHKLHKDMRVEHAHEFILISPNEFPNFKFIQSLKNDLEDNQGSIFMWSKHERDVLTNIKNQIIKLNATKQYQCEIEFINNVLPGGKRELIDLFEIAKGGVFYPNTKGSNSIKKVLPAAIKHSKYIQQKYSKPIYGDKKFIKSLNFKNISWVQKLENSFRDPYDILGDFSDDAINQGGMAATTFAKLQFEDLSLDQRKKLIKSLLMYCELDTFAMALITETLFH